MEQKVILPKLDCGVPNGSRRPFHAKNASLLLEILARTGTVLADQLMGVRVLRKVKY